MTAVPLAPVNFRQPEGLFALGVRPIPVIVEAIEISCTRRQILQHGRPIAGLIPLHRDQALRCGYDLHGHVLYERRPDRELDISVSAIMCALLPGYLLSFL